MSYFFTIVNHIPEYELQQSRLDIEQIKHFYLARMARDFGVGMWKAKILKVEEEPDNQFGGIKLRMYLHSDGVSEEQFEKTAKKLIKNWRMFDPKMDKEAKMLLALAFAKLQNELYQNAVSDRTEYYEQEQK